MHLGDHCLIVALGIAADGQKHALGLWDGSTENTTVCQGLLTNLQSRGLRTDRSLLVILDGSKALRKAVRATFGDAALVQRCQVHKTRNILEYLSDRQRPWAQAILRRAYQSADVKTAQRLLLDLARRLENEYPSAAESVREGLDETLTVLTLNLSARLRRSLATTNAAESLLSRTRHVKRNVKRWRGGQMMLRWVAAGVLEAVPTRKPMRADSLRLLSPSNSLQPVMPIVVAALLSLRSLIRSRAALQFEILALRHQLQVLERPRRPRLRLTAADRLLWVSFSRIWREWRPALVLVQPATVIAWHRRGFRLFWTWKSRHGPGRPAV